MINISNFFDKFLKLDRNNAHKISTILETIKEGAGVQLFKEMISVKGDKLYISCSPVLKNEIFMHKEKVENSLKQKNIFLKII